MSLTTDRWIEVDLSWFKPNSIVEQVQAFMDRVNPLFTDISGEKGVILNCGWVIDLVTEWTGNPDQPLPFRSQLMKAWEGQSYLVLQTLVAALRQSAEDRGITDFRIGVLFVAWGQFVIHGDLYDIESSWFERHGEMYADHEAPQPNLLPDMPLRGERYPYASRPEGLVEGESFATFFGEQWGSLSRFLGFTAIHLRDQFMGAMVYNRKGPYGVAGPSDPQKLIRYSQDFIEIFREVKRGNPNALLMGYSSAISAVAELRVGCVDLESLVKDGAIDIWIDQTWGGAWQDWWGLEWLGWTFQLSNLLTHRAVIEGGNLNRTKPCKHYHLIETWDAWEPWDTLHQVPEKLRWAIWAFSHAAVYTPEGVRVPDGSYISWANNREAELLSEPDIAFLVTQLNAAQRSASKLEHVYGPTLIYNRNMMAWLNSTLPDSNCSEWIDDQAAMLMKWGVPCLSASRMEWLGEITEPEACLLQVPGQLSQEEKALLCTMKGDGVPLLMIGRADQIDPDILQLAGVSLRDNLMKQGFYKGYNRQGQEKDDLASAVTIHLPVTQPIQVTDGVVMFETDRTPTVVKSQENHAIYWQPQDLREPDKTHLSQHQLGNLLPYAVVSQLLIEGSVERQLSHIQPPPFTQPITVHLWKSDGVVHILIGNLETGIIGDSRTSRTVELRVNRSHVGLPKGQHHLISIDDEIVRPNADVAGFLHFTLEIGAEASKVYTLAQSTD